MQISEIRKGFDGSETRRVEFDVLAEDFERAEALFHSREVSSREGWLAAAMSGVVAMERDAREGVDDDTAIKQLNRIDSAYIGMKNKAFLLMKDNERMELSRSGYIAENELLRKRLARLEQELLAYRESGEPARQDAPGHDVNVDDNSRSWWDRIRGR